MNNELILEAAARYRDAYDEYNSYFTADIPKGWADAVADARVALKLAADALLAVARTGHEIPGRST